MVKALIIILGIGWLLGQLIRYFLRSKLAKFAQQVSEAAKEQQQAQQRNTNPKNGNVHVDHIPDNFKAKRSKEIKGGDYVDYEEVKE
ncbi:DUF4834 family protein [Belliella marina]|uniref:DUF4834 family protein n=1 Tax=Belliella marina TaxID=1644146 RepID=A0ABW4VN58_9BACT